MQTAWQAWTFVDFGPKRSVQDGRAEGGGSLRRTAIRAGGLLAVETLKSYWVQEP